MSFPRYPEYKDSGMEWLGRVPAHWGLAPFKRLVEFQNGADYKAVEADDGYPVYGSGGVFAYASEYLYDGESVLLGRKGTVDKPLHVVGKFWTVDTMYWTRIRPDACGKFCYYAATSIPFAYYSTNTALPSMTQSALGAHLIAYPARKEQEDIAAFLDRETGKIDALSAEYVRLVELLKEKRQAVISHAVTKGLDPKVPMKGSGVEWLGEVPAHWGVTPMKYLVRLQSGGTPSKACLAYWEGDIPWASAKDMKVDQLSDTEDHITELAINDGAASLVSSRAVIVVVRGMILARMFPVAITLRQMAINQDLKAVMCGQRLHPEFFAWYLRGTAEESLSRLDEAGHGTKALRMDAWVSLEVSLPPLAEQKAIAEHIDAATQRFDTLMAEAKKAIDLLNERRSALISAAVTGKIDVRGLVPAAASKEAI